MTEYMSVYVCVQKPEEFTEGVGFPVAGITAAMSCRVGTGVEPGSSARAECLTSDPHLQPQTFLIFNR